MTTLISVLLVLASIALVLVVIVQKSKGGGLAAGFSGAHNIMGVRQSNNAIEQATWYLIATIMVLCIAYTGFDSKGNAGQNALQQQIEQKAKEQKLPTVPSAIGGGQPTQTTAQPTAPTAPATQEATSAPAAQPTAPEQPAQ